MPPPISLNLAMSIARFPLWDGTSTPKSQPRSVAIAREKLSAQGFGATKSEVSIYTGVSDRPLGWKRRKSVKRGTFVRENAIRVQRWDGRCRMASPWDDMRREHDVWYPNGDCLIHLYAAGTSHRGPAFRIPFECLLRSDCEKLLTKHLFGYSSTVSSPSSSRSSDASYFAVPIIPQNGRYDLYIPTPPLPVGPDASLRHHIRTRNFFAWVCEKPLVGENLGAALIDLLQTMTEWRSEDEDNQEDLKEYMDEMCYNDMCDAPEHAVGMLVFAEHIKDELLWSEAFRHVVGMHDACFECAGFAALSRGTRSLITRAHLSLSLKLHHVSISLATFLDDELSPSQISLSPPNIQHLARFTDFLHTYWMSATGYYPPLNDSDSASILGLHSKYNFKKALLYEMRKQFQALHDFLVNTTFLPHHPSPKAAMGGLCVLQSLQAFEFCHNYTPLQHPLPHLPEVPKVAKEKMSLSSLMGKKDKLYVDPRLASLSTLNKASNAGKPELLQSSLVKAFRVFEKQSVFADAEGKGKRGKKVANQEVEKRKVRWVLVYGILQTLRTVTEVDEPFKDVNEGVNYFLCATVPRVPWWVESEGPQHGSGNDEKEMPSAAILSHNSSNASSSTLYTGNSSMNEHATSTRPTTASPTEHKMTIEPDIDHVALSRRNSHATGMPAPKMSDTISRASTVTMRPSHHRSSLSLSMPARPNLHLKLRTKSLPTSAPIQVIPIQPARARGTVKRALSSLGNMPKLQQPTPMRLHSAVEILVDAYGNGLSNVDIGWEGQEELHRLKRSSMSSSSSGESDYEDAVGKVDLRDGEDIEDCVRSPLTPAHAYDGCFSPLWSQTSWPQNSHKEDRVFDEQTVSPSAMTVNRLGSDASDKAWTSTVVEQDDATPRPGGVQRRGSQVVYKELGERMSKVYVSVADVKVSSEDESTDDDLVELEYGRKVKKRELLTLIEALALEAMF